MEITDFASLSASTTAGEGWFLVELICWFVAVRIVERRRERRNRGN